LKTLDARTPERWRSWLAEHHDSESEVWLVFPKRHTGPSMFRKRPMAWRQFESLPPSHRRNYIAWIDSAKRQATKRRRWQEAVRLLAAGKTPGLK